VIDRLLGQRVDYRIFLYLYDELFRVEDPGDVFQQQVRGKGKISCFAVEELLAVDRGKEVLDGICHYSICTVEKAAVVLLVKDLIAYDFVPLIQDGLSNNARVQGNTSKLQKNPSI